MARGDTRAMTDEQLAVELLRRILHMNDDTYKGYIHHQGPDDDGVPHLTFDLTIDISDTEADLLRRLETEPTESPGP